jgi:hypothetical protein
VCGYSELAKIILSQCLVQVELSLTLVLVEITNWHVVQVLRTIEGLEASTSPVSLLLRHADMSMLYLSVCTYVVVENWSCLVVCMVWWLV